MKNRVKKCEAPCCSHRIKTGRFCATCRCRKSRAKDPVRYSFNNKKNRADQRGIFWDLTLEQFREWCHKTDYMVGKGRTIGSFDCDRIVEGILPGYTVGNLQKLDKQANIKKFLEYNWRDGTATVTRFKKEVPEPDDKYEF